MTTPAIHIERMRPADAKTSIAVAARAFWDDPMFTTSHRIYWPNTETSASSLQLFTTALRTAKCG